MDRSRYLTLLILLGMLTALTALSIDPTLSSMPDVAREFGVPCIVNTRTATARIKTGDWLTLDGEAGLVHLETKLETCEAN